MKKSGNKPQSNHSYASPLEGEREKHVAEFHIQRTGKSGFKGGNKTGKNDVKAIKMVGNCPHCGEPITLVFTKKEIKEVYKGFKLPPLQATIRMEEKKLRELNKEPWP